MNPARTKADIQKEEIGKTEKSIKDFESSMKTMDAATRKNMTPVLDVLKENLKKYQDINNEYFAMLLMGDKYQNDQNVESYKEDVKHWETNYPADYTPIVKKRLQKFLDVTKDVDFAAELKTSYNKKVFVNPVYERKSSEWKQTFRAGKDVTTMARSFVEQWLTELR